MSWQSIPLADICTFIDYRGKSPPKSDIGIPLLTAKNVKKGFINNEPREFIEVGKYDSWMTRGFPRGGDILFTTEAPLGHVAQFPSSGTFAIAQRLICLQPNEGIHARFLLHYMLSPEFQIELRRKATGSTAKGIRASELKKIDVRIPSLDEQKRIATILDKADEIRNHAEKSQNVKNSFLYSVFLDIFGDTTNEKRYARTTINENSLTVSKGTTPMTHGMDFVSEGIPFLRVQDLVNNPITPSFASRAIDESTHDFLSRSQLKPDDILISIAGTIGRVSIVPKDSPEMNCNQAVAFVRLAETTVLRHCYLMHWLNSRDARLQMAGSSVTATISNLSLGKIKDLKVPVPPLDLQLKFEKICNEFTSTPNYSVKVDNLVSSVSVNLLANH